MVLDLVKKSDDLTTKQRQGWRNDKRLPRRVGREVEMIGTRMVSLDYIHRLHPIDTSILAYIFIIGTKVHTSIHKKWDLCE